jgi:hypothetical protein
MARFSPTKQHGEWEEIENPSTAYGRRRRNWTDAHDSIPPGQVVDASCGNKRCIAVRHAYLRLRIEQPGKYRKIADRVHRLKMGQHFDVRGVGSDERSRNRFRSGLYAAARLDRVSVRGQPDGSVHHESRRMVEYGKLGAHLSRVRLRTQQRACGSEVKPKVRLFRFALSGFCTISRAI